MDVRSIYMAELHVMPVDLREVESFVALPLFEILDDSAHIKEGFPK